MGNYKPEGIHWEVKNDNAIEKVKEAMKTGDILEAKVLKSDEKLNTYLDLGDDITAIIPYDEIEYSYNNTRIKSVAIMSKVGKTVKFKVVNVDESGEKTLVHCSRAAAQKDCYENFVSKLTPGDIIQAHVTHIESYGIFCDIGCGLIALLPIENVSITRIVNPKSSLRTWKDLFAVVKSIDEDGRITLTHKELLGTWDEEVAKFKVGEVVPGIVRTIEDYGVFISLSQNLSGLAESNKAVMVDDKVNVYIKEINRETMKVKLAIVTSETLDPDYVSKVKFTYKQKHGHISEWKYSPDSSNKYIGTKFDK